MKTDHSSDQFLLRFPNGMRDRIREVAEKNGRSMNAEIVAVLEKTFPQPKIDEDKEFINTMLKREFTRAEKEFCHEVVKKANQIAERRGELIRYIAGRQGDKIVVLPYSVAFDKGIPGGAREFVRKLKMFFGEDADFVGKEPAKPLQKQRNSL